MVFSSLSFLSIFLPVVLILYWILPGVRTQNTMLLIASLLFYAYGEPVYVFLMIGSAFINYVWALLIDHFPIYKKGVMILAVIQNIGILGVFKYAGFFVETWNSLTGMHCHVPEIALPIGISFYTFQALSYVIDVYRGDTTSQKNYLKLLLYISFFPQLIAGPIVKYHDIEKELSERRKDLSEIVLGIRRFVIGLSKKVLISNYLGAMVDTLFASDLAEINILCAWLGAVGYMLQIYFDFSGYSDMAIGIGQMMGFHFKENFNYPYTAVSIQDFWTRWHMSLSGWFKEYLYIPLGGNRKGKVRTVINKYIVFFCTGFWHGAALQFIFWGLFHGSFLMLEEYVPMIRKEGGKIKKACNHVYVILVVMIGFVFFRADTMSQGALWVSRMFTGFFFSQASMRLLLSLLMPLNIIVLLAAIVGSTPWVKKIREKNGVTALSCLASLCLLVFCIFSLAGGTYNPFIYFRF